jgi:hypothetical protein
MKAQTKTAADRLKQTTFITINHGGTIEMTTSEAAYRFWFVVEVEGAMFPFKTLEEAECWALQEGWRNYTVKALQRSESDDLVEFYREHFAGLPEGWHDAR